MITTAEYQRSRAIRWKANRRSRNTILQLRLTRGGGSERGHRRGLQLRGDGGHAHYFGIKSLSDFFVTSVFPVACEWTGFGASAGSPFAASFPAAR
jgi:hypothetical protein